MNWDSSRHKSIRFFVLFIKKNQVVVMGLFNHKSKSNKNKKPNGSKKGDRKKLTSSQPWKGEALRPLNPLSL